ncbi:MAG: TIGR00645 family protein [Methylacidiphilales bacterium]|nr:TIGR00645 family protein [Candidatus Methylacidiphilales bacterium]
MKKVEYYLEWLVFAARWLQAPLYLGLIVAQIRYAFVFFHELVVLFEEDHPNAVMLGVLGLVDAIMLVNLVIVVLIGGWQTYISKLDLREHPDHPSWLDDITPGSMKIKLSTAIVSISGIHLLKTFLNAEILSDRVIVTQLLLHLAFLFSAVLLAYSDKLSHHDTKKH